MLNVDPVFLSRMQFGLTVAFHILFPTFNIGLGCFIALMEACWLRTQKPVYLTICKFWMRIFALTFGMGVVSGIVLSYEIGANFGPFMDSIGNVLGPLLNLEVLSAFFLEAGFLGIMLFGWKRVSPRMHFTATCLVAVGTVISAFWIMSANSWMQVPAGFHIQDNIVYVDSWVQAVLNPMLFPRFFHMILASLIATVFVLAGIASFYLIKQRHGELARTCLAFSVVIAAILLPAQLIVGDVLGLSVYHHQPLKTAAIEGLWETQKGAPLVLFGVPDVSAAKNHWEIKLPKLASLINTHQWDGELQGLMSTTRDNWPVVAAVFFGFRIMVGIGLLLMLLAFYGAWLLWRGRLYAHRPIQYALVWTSPLAFVATLAGWVTSESGRQPWVVYNLLRTNEMVSDLSGQQVLISFSLFLCIYLTIFCFYLYYLVKFVRRGPVHLEEPPMTVAYLANPNQKEPV